MSDDSSEVGSIADGGGGLQVDSNDEASDSDLSDVDPLDSDIEGVYISLYMDCIFSCNGVQRLRLNTRGLYTLWE